MSSVLTYDKGSVLTYSPVIFKAFQKAYQYYPRAPFEVLTSLNRMSELIKKDGVDYDIDVVYYDHSVRSKCFQLKTLLNKISEEHDIDTRVWHAQHDDKTCTLFFTAKKNPNNLQETS